MTQATRPAFCDTRLTGDTPDSTRQSLIGDYRAIVVTSMAAILGRSERGPNPPFIDTKIDLRTGRDIPQNDPVRGPGAIYGWVQARGLEALARYHGWLLRQPPWLGSQDHQPRIRSLLARLLDKLDTIREQNNGHLHFLMDKQGRPLRICANGVQPGPSLLATEATGLTDLFYIKGVAEAAAVLNDGARLAWTEAQAQRVLSDIDGQTFRFDQQALDPGNPVVPVPGRHTHAPRMLALSMATRLYELTGNQAFDAVGRSLMDGLLRSHVALDDRPPFRAGDMWEFLGDDGLPYRTGSTIWSDPGHAIELAGFALHHLNVTPRRPGDAELASTWRNVLLRNFQNGWHPSGVGICKGYDLIARKPINPQMPWWSLPETLRAVVEAGGPGTVDTALFSAFSRASNAFFAYYLLPGRHLMAYQCLEPDSRVADTVPATPDADPGYHTNLCLMRVTDMLEDWPRA